MKRITQVLMIIAITSFGYAQELTYIDFGSANTGFVSEGNWNNITTNTNNETGITANLISSTGAETNVILTVDDPFDINNTAGTQTPDGSLPFPATASRDSFFGETGVFNGNTQPTGGLILSGLDPAKYYSFSVFASRMGVSDNREALYTITGSTVKTGTLNASNNETETVDINNIQPNAGGEITFRAQPGANNTNSTGFYYLGAIEMTKTDAPLSIEDFEFRKSIVIHPNPSADKFSIRFNMNNTSKVSIAMYDVAGKMVTSIFNDEVSAGVFNHTWNRTSGEGETIAAGLYILEINANGHTMSKRVVLK